MPVRILATEATRADCSHAGELIEGLVAEHLIADRGYDSDAIVEQAQRQGMQAIIPPRKNRKELREYDKHLYRQRHLVENAFLHLKQWRGIATRYAKRLSSFLAAVQIRCLVLWLHVS
jgi:transposase